MIRTTVERNPLNEAFEVVEPITVESRETALLLDHILNHLKVLATLDMPDADDELFELLQEHYEWPSLERVTEADWSRARDRIIQELQQLTALFVQRSTPHLRGQYVEELGIPFLNYGRKDRVVRTR
jgi:hypothetical protein